MHTFFRDVQFQIMLLLIIVVILMLPWINPPTEENPGDIAPPGNVMVEITWQPGNNDVDLWVYSKGELRPVGYSNKGGKIWNLLRDDLGHDDIQINYENAFTRGIPSGEYIINLHCYRCNGEVQTVVVKVSTKKNADQRLTVIAKTTVKLNPREEVTAMRFKLDKDGNLIKDSLNHIYQPLRHGDNFGLNP